MRLTSSLLLVLLSMVTHSALAQDGRYVKITTTEGRTFFGTVQSESPQEIVLQTETLGEVAVPKLQIASMKDSEREAVTKDEGKNAQPSRYFFSPSAFQLPKGEGYYQNTLLLYNQFSYGLTDHVTIGIPIVIPFLAGFTIKAGTQLGEANEEGHSLNASAGILYLVPIVDELNSGAGIAFGNLSYGNENNNVTFGLGQAFDSDPNSDFNAGESPLINLGGMLKVGKRKWLMTENYFYMGGPNTDAGSVVSIGLRAGRANDSGALWDIALLTSGSFILPSIGLTVPFSREQAAMQVTY
ncbi:MAG: hypothetical protein L7S67_02865 [Flavobacteriales bacterium]|jgi:hypothetical protein|nr:hypothetical protein [Flavobacteriales bacterium]